MPTDCHSGPYIAPAILSLPTLKIRLITRFRYQAEGFEGPEAASRTRAALLTALS